MDGVPRKVVTLEKSFAAAALSTEGSNDMTPLLSNVSPMSAIDWIVPLPLKEVTFSRD